MKVHLIKVQSIENYVRDNIQSKKAFETWLSIVKRADWNSPQDIIRTFNSADILRIFWGKDQTELFLILVATNTGLSASIILGSKRYICL